jgi:zinc protease
MIFYTGDAEFTPANRYAVRSLSEVLETKLLETLREALGGTYSVNVSGQINREPRTDYSVVINFGSAPDRADSLYRAVQQVIEDIRTKGVSEADVQKVREQQLRTLEVSERENAYWLGNISARLENGEDPAGLLQYREFIKALTPAQIQEAARRYLSGANVARFVLLPEKPAS